MICVRFCASQFSFFLLELYGSRWLAAMQKLPQFYFLHGAWRGVAWRCVPSASLWSSVAAMAGANQSRWCNLPTFLDTILAAALLLFFPQFSPTATTMEYKRSNRSLLLGEPRQCRPWARTRWPNRACTNVSGSASGDEGRKFTSIDIVGWARRTGAETACRRRRLFDLLLRHFPRPARAVQTGEIFFFFDKITHAPFDS